MKKLNIFLIAIIAFLAAKPASSGVDSTREAILQILREKGILSSSDVFSGGSGPFTRTATTISPTTAGDTLALSGPLTFNSGLVLDAEQPHILGPADDILKIYAHNAVGQGQALFLISGSDPGNSFIGASIRLNGAIAEGQPAPNLSTATWFFSEYSPVNYKSSGFYLMPGDDTVVGGPVGGFKPYIAVNSDIIPHDDSVGSGIAALGSASHGFSRLYLDYTDTSTVGAVQIDKPSGQAIIAAGQSTVVVTDSLVTAHSHVLAVLATDDTTATGVRSVICTGGSFTIRTNAAANANTKVNFFVVGGD